MARDEIMGAQKLEHGNWRDPTVRHGLPPSPTSVDKVEQIHSGHFMISNPHRIKKHGYNFEDAVRSLSTSYRFGKGVNDIFEIDSSFAKLFECLSLAYNGAAIISPKWKDFKGMKLSWKDKIRLNNAIWREWHCQFVFGYKPVLCHFSFPITDLIHSTPQAVVLEGKYWKRTLGTVVKEYMKWRAFYKKRRTSSISADGITDSEPASPFQDKLYQEIMGRTHSPEPVPMVLDEEALLSEFTDTLFTSLNHNFLFPNARELSHLSTNADIMQPGLVQLQPSIDELMDTFEPLQAWLPGLQPSTSGVDVMRSVAQSQSPSPSAFLFTGRTSSRPILLPSQFSLNGSASSSSTQADQGAAASLQMPQAEQPSMMGGLTLQNSMTSDVQTLDDVLSDQQQQENQQQQQQMLGVADMQQQQQQHEFSPQPMNTNQQIDSQQFLLTQQQQQQQQVLQPQQQQPHMSTQQIRTQLVATQQQLDEVTRQVSAAQHQLTQQVSVTESLEQQQQQAVSQQFGSHQLQQQQIQLMQQQQQQLVIQQQSQQTQLQSLGITLTNVPTQHATLHSTGGDTTHILLNSTDISNLQSQLSGNNISQLPQGASITTLQGMGGQQVLNPLTSVQVRIAPASDLNTAVKVATPVHEMAVSQQQQRTLQQQQQQQQQTHTLRTLNQAQGAAVTTVTGGQQQHTPLGLETIVGGNQTQAKQLLQQLANQVSQNNQQPQQQGIPMQQQQQQQEDSKAIITQILGGQNMIPSGNSNFISIQPQQQMQQQQQQQQQQQPFPIQITKVQQHPQKKSTIKTRMAQSVTGQTRSVISIAKSTSQPKASSSFTTSNTLQPGAKAKSKRQPKPKPPAKIAPAPPIVTNTNSMTSSTSSAALLTQLLTQGRFESAIRASTPPQSTVMKPQQQTISNTLLLQPVKAELSTATTTCAQPTVATYVTTDLPGGLPFLVTTTTASEPFFSTPPIQTTTNMNRLLGVPDTVDIASQPTTAESSPTPSFTIGMVSSPPSASETPRKDTHISAEQKRRVNIKSGFDMLNTIVPALVQNPNAKISKAQMLQKAVEYTKKLQHERSNTNIEIEKLRKEVAGLNLAISETQSQLPASGVPVTRQRFDKMKDVYDEYVRDRTATNWKFWIFSIIIRPLFESYNASVSTASTEELFRTVLSWLDQHCSLLALRPTVLSSLTLLSRTTSILSDPAQVPQQAADAVSKRNDTDDNSK